MWQCANATSVVYYPALLSSHFYWKAAILLQLMTWFIISESSQLPHLNCLFNPKRWRSAGRRTDKWFSSVLRLSHWCLTVKLPHILGNFFLTDVWNKTKRNIPGIWDWLNVSIFPRLEGFFASHPPVPFWQLHHILCVLRRFEKNIVDMIKILCTQWRFTHITFANMGLLSHFNDIIYIKDLLTCSQWHTRREPLN